jgi:L-threonylcarbamoyladenylate synthase
MNKNFHKNFEDVEKHLINGGMIAYPTETLWGLGVNALNEKAVEKLFQLKGRETTKAMSILVANPSQVSQWAEVSDLSQYLMSEFWPGALTLVLPLKDKKLLKVSGGLETIGVRCSSFSLLRKWLYRLDFPLTTTSANQSGQANPTSKKDLNWLPKDVQIVDGPFFKSKGSTVIGVTDNKIHYFREGDLDKKIIELRINNFFDKNS